MLITKDGIFHTMETMLLIEDRIWFPERSYNKLYCYDLKKKKILYSFELGKECVTERLFSHIMRIGNSIFLIPFQTDKLYRVDVDKEQIEEINLYMLLGEDVLGGKQISFLSAHNYNGVIYMVGARNEIVVAYDCKSNSARLYDISKADISLTERDSMFCRKSMVHNKKLFIPLCGNNIVVIFDLETKIIESFEVGTAGNGYAAICYDGKDFWLAPRGEGAIVRWNYNENVYREFKNFPEGYVANGYSDIFYINEKIILIPMRSNMVLTIEKKEAKILRYMNLGFEYKMCFCQNDDMLYFFSAETGKLYSINDRLKTIEEDYIMPEREDAEYYRKKSSDTYKYFQGIKKDKSYLREDYSGSLMDYLCYVLQP